MRLTRLLILIFAVLLMVGSSAISSTEIKQAGYPERVAQWQAILCASAYVPDELIVEFESARSLSSVSAAAIQGFTISEMFRYRPVVVYKIPSGANLAERLAELEGQTGIRSVSPNYLRYCSFTPNDTLFNRQENLLPIHAEDGWDVTTGSSLVTVATIDTGIDKDHPEFAGRVVYTENFYDPGSQGANNASDDSGHGTAVAGIIAAKGNNEIGIAGLSWDVRIMAFRACGGPDLKCTIASEIQAIDAAVAHGADVINLSLGGVGTNDVEGQAIRAAYNAGLVIFAAAGNGSPGALYQFTGNAAIDKANMYYPAAFPEVIGVAALDNKNGSITDPASLTRASFSNYGEDIVSVAAVGTAVQTTVPYMPKNLVPYAIYATPNYSRVSGTSFACPQVTGTACLLLSKYPDASPLEIRSLIEQTAWPMGGPDADSNGVDDYLGYGLLDVGAALGNAGGGDNIFENQSFLVGITPSPILADDIFVVVKCKMGCDSAPHVSYFVQESGENKSVTMEPLPAHANTFLGRLNTTGSGPVTFQVTSTFGGNPLVNLVFIYTFVD